MKHATEISYSKHHHEREKRLEQQPKVDRTVQEAEKYRDENEAKQGEDSGHEWLGEPAVHVAVPQRTDAEILMDAQPQGAYAQGGDAEHSSAVPGS